MKNNEENKNENKESLKYGTKINKNREIIFCSNKFQTGHENESKSLDKIVNDNILNKNKSNENLIQENKKFKKLYNNLKNEQEKMKKYISDIQNQKASFEEQKNEYQININDLTQKLNILEEENNTLKSIINNRNLFQLTMKIKSPLNYMRTQNKLIK